MERALRRLYKGYAVALVSALIMFVPYLGLISLLLVAIATYYIYTGFKELSEVNKKYAPGRRGILAILLGTGLAMLSIIFEPIALLALIVLVYGVAEYFKGLWALGDLKGGKPIKFGVVLASIAFAVSVLNAVLAFNLLAPNKKFEGISYNALAFLVLLDQFLAGASLVFMLFGVRGILKNLSQKGGGGE